MCGRYTLTVPVEELDKLLSEIEIEFDPGPRYNIAPEQQTAAVLNSPPRRLMGARWGWPRPHAAHAGRPLINARSETAAERPTFRAAVRARRCVLPADGFYEWGDPHGGGRGPWYFSRRDGQPFLLAGLWMQDGRQVFNTILTTRPNQLVEPVHDRMPVVVPADAVDAWLSTEPLDRIYYERISRPWNAADWASWPVGAAVNRVGYDAPDCIARQGEQGVLF